MSPQTSRRACNTSHRPGTSSRRRGTSSRRRGTTARRRTLSAGAIAVVLSVGGVLTAASRGVTAAAAGAAPSDRGDPKVLTAKSSLVSLTPSLPKAVVRATSAKHRWRPGKAIYGTASRNQLKVKGAGGTTIRVNEIYPTDKHGKFAKGKFPVVMTMTPYGKGSGGSSAPGSAQKSGGGSVTGGANNYLVQRGYINIVEDVRGTGSSNGSWGLFDPIQQRDAVKLLHWAAHLKHSNGRVGTYGPSYLGIDQMLLAGTVHKHSPLKAIFPLVPANDSYRDTAFMGGLLDFEFSETYLGLTGTLNAFNPLRDTTTDAELLADLVAIEADHANGLAKYHAGITTKILAGGPEAYDEKYWRARAPETMLKRIARNRIPAFMVGGEFDIFQHGEPLDYAAVQNAWAHRPLNAPMRPHQKVTGRYQLIDGPWEHLNGSSVGVDKLELEWFDTWLKHKHTGMAHARRPLHYYDLGTGKFRETTNFPFRHAMPHRFYLHNDDSLRRNKPRSAAGSDVLAWSSSGSPCGRPIDQWAMGGVSIPSHMSGLKAACADDDSTTPEGPSLIRYTSRPLKRARTLAGPISARIIANATTSETQWVAEVEIVTPGGAAYPISEGALLGSLRKQVARRSWHSHGRTILPYHRYTRASQHAVKPMANTAYNIEIFPTLATIPKGDSLRLTLSTSDTPHLTPLPSQLAKLTGGVYNVQTNHRHPSSVTVELRKPGRAHR
ncbi:MAG: CocE/NonD family hydrolase [Frankiaceae bacterium]|nr:CocE/NonD family hydrolase [Frankiaceae bacterium]